MSNLDRVDISLELSYIPSALNRLSVIFSDV